MTRGFAGTTLAQARRLALALPGVIEAPHFKLTSFRVGGKIFATAAGDESFLHVFVPEEERDRWLALQPGSVEKLFWGQRAVGLKIALRTVSPGSIKALLASAWASKAPKNLLRSSKRQGK